jgi:predicted O-methyltransferase YrrM
MNNITKAIASQIEEAVKDVPGWSSLDQLLSLFTLALTSSHLKGDILELGSWCGRSAIALSMAARLSGNTTIYCVDLFPEKNDWYQNPDGTYSFKITVDSRKVGAYGEQTVWAEPYLRDIAPVYDNFSGTLQAFESAVAANKLSDYITTYKGDLLSFSENADKDLSLRMAFIDGDHSYKAVANDIAIVEKYLIPGGWICFDDAFSSYEGVNEAIQKHIIESGNYSCFQQLTRKFFVAKRN